MNYPNHTLTLSLSPEARESLSAFAAAKAVGNYREAQQRRNDYRLTIARELREQEYARELERIERERQELLAAEQWQREEDRRKDEEAFLDSFDRLPTGRVAMWRRVRQKLSDFSQTGCLRGYHTHSNWNKRNCGRKLRRSW